MEFIEAPAFARHLSDYLSDGDYRAVQEELGTNPELGDLMPSNGGFDKDEASDLNPREKKALKKAMEGELAARAARRPTGRSRRIC